MLTEILLHLGSIVIFVWGIAYIIPVKSVVGGFEPLSEENKRMLIMEWVTGGLTPCYIGVLVYAVTFFREPSGTTALIGILDLCVDNLASWPRGMQ